MRILHVNKFLYRRGGAEGYMEDVAALQRAAGHDVGFWGMAHPENEHLDLAATLAPFIEMEPPPTSLRDRLEAATRILWSTKAAAGMAAAIVAFRPDVAHLHNIYHQLSPSILRPLRAAGVPIVLTAHDYKLVCPSYQMLAGGDVCDACVGRTAWHATRLRCKDNSLASSMLLSVEATAHRRLGVYDGIGAMICPSRFLRDQLVAGGLAPDRLHLVRHFVDTAGLDPKVDAGGGVVAAGRLAPEKGFDVAIRAAAALAPGVVLDIAGDGPSRAELEVLAHDVAPGRVRFHGRLAKDDLHQLVRSSAVAIVPSRWHENQPMAVLEALALGVPVVTTRLGGLPELVRPGIDGALVDHDDPAALAGAVAEILADTDRALAMGAAGRRRIVEEFDPARHLSALDGCYDAAARSSTRSQARSQ